ncbi:MAG: CHASE2 domain-containing protein [Spirulina sp. SIO3F2]|nr:CHASE2 domain-containing protein [Spirulina sp. SIO3F2]
MNDIHKQVILRFGYGSFEQGFDVNLRIITDEKTLVDRDGFLPENLALLHTYNQLLQSYQDQFRWNYNGYYRGFRALEAISIETTNISVRDSADELIAQFNLLLDQSLAFQPIREALLHHLSPSDSIRFVIRTVDPVLQWLPWHLCNLFQRYPQSGATLSLPPKSHSLTFQNLKSKVRVLPILGDSTNINIDADLILLREQLPQSAEILDTKIATSLAAIGEALWQQNPDILFFAGHSSSRGGQGLFYINEQEGIAIADLKFALKKAIGNGLKLAIFNSCDGLKLAQDLADLNLPAIIVMRERIPDEAAQKFLEYFLAAFANDDTPKPLTQAVREAQERLQHYEQQFPCVSWLPVLFQQSEAKDLTWADLRLKVTTPAVSQPQPSSVSPANSRVQRPRKSLFSQAWKATTTTLLTVGAVLGIQALGWLEIWELRTLDQWLNQRLWFINEGYDDNLLLVEVTNTDIGDRDLKALQNASVLPEELAQAFQMLSEQGAEIIASLIYRQTEEDNLQLNAQFAENSKLVNVCAYATSKHKGIHAPPAINNSAHLGFNNSFSDRDNTSRRDLIRLNKGYLPCETTNSFSFQTAQRYLASQGINLEFQGNQLKHQQRILAQQLRPDSSGYRNINADGFQVLVNYRMTRSIAARFTFSELLNGDIPEHLIRGRIVLLGTTDPTFDARWRLPYQGDRERSYSSGVEVMAHRISQLVQAGLNQRPLLQPVNTAVNFLWLLLWTSLGIVTMCIPGSSFQRFQRLGVLVFLIYGLGFVMLIQGFWIICVAPILGVLVGSASFALQQKRK